MKVAVIAPFMEDDVDPRYSSGRDHTLGHGANSRGTANRDQKSNWSESKTRETGLVERKPL